MEAEEVRGEKASCSYDEFVLTGEGLRLRSNDCFAGQSELLFSIIVSIHKPELKLLIRAIDSVKQQVYDKWELVLVDDASGDPRLTECLNELKNEDSGSGSSLSDKRHISFAPIMASNRLAGHGSLSLIRMTNFIPMPCLRSPPF